MSTQSEVAPATVRDWPGMRSEYSWIPPHDGPSVTKPHQIGISFSHHHDLVYECGSRAHRTDVAPGAVFVTADEPIAWTRVYETTEALEIYPERDLLEGLAAESGASAVEFEPVAGGRDAVVLTVATILKRTHARDEHLSDVAASTLAHRLAARLLTSYCGLPERRRPARGTLDHRTVDRVAEFVEANLHTTLSLDRLAAVAALSPFHFARAFKATTGLAPNQFVTTCRTERAKTLLLGTTASVAEVAQQVGFSNLSHFRRVFRRSTGYLPGALRRR